VGFADSGRCLIDGAICGLSLIADGPCHVRILGNWPHVGAGLVSKGVTKVRGPRQYLYRKITYRERRQTGRQAGAGGRRKTAWTTKISVANGIE
jgi:hypothetical protein